MQGAVLHHMRPQIGAPTMRKEPVNRRPEHRLTDMAKDPFGAGVKTEDAALQVHQHKGHADRLIHNREQTPITVGHRLQRQL